MAKNRPVVRVILHLGDKPQGWFGVDPIDRHHVSELVQVLAHATNRIFLHPPTGDQEEKVIFDLLPDRTYSLDAQKTWAKMECDRLQSFGYSAAVAPEWKE